MTNNKKSLLVLLQPHRSYEGSLLEMLIESLKTTDFQVEYLDITNLPSYNYSSLLDKIKNIYNRTILKNNTYYLNLENNFYNKYYLKKIKNFKNSNSKKYDYILVIKPEEFSPKVIKEVSKLGNEMVGYIWDGLRLFLKSNLERNFRYLKDVYIFDHNNISDHPKLKLSFCTNFLVLQNNKIVPYIDRSIDLFYIGDIGGKEDYQRRDLLINKLLENIEGNFDVRIYKNKSFISKDLKLINEIKFSYTTEYLSLLDSIERTRQSKVVLDICKGHHIGLSFRFFECLSTETKIITNNKDIINYDFYNPNNILVIDFEKNTLDKFIFDSFLASPYQSVDKEILKKYDIQNWINYLFKIEPYQKISRIE